MQVKNLKKSLRRKRLRCYYDSMAVNQESWSDPRLRNPVFVLGSERSGTTIIGDLLKQHKNIHCTVERDPVFSYIYTLAMQVARMRRERDACAERLRRCYLQNWMPAIADCESWRCKCQDGYAFPDGRGLKSCWKHKGVNLFVDKSHPAVLFPDLLVDVFPEARFIWIYRDGRDVLTSMLGHHGVNVTMNFGKKVLVEDNLPNPWAGVATMEEARAWFKLDIAAKCAKRWAAWSEAGLDWADRAPERIFTVQYEEMVRQPVKVLGDLLRFLGMPPCESFDRAVGEVFGTSVGRWRNTLSAQELAAFETHGAATMERLGYAPGTDAAEARAD